MPSPGGEITHVSDTALMVAACRAHETELDDAFVRDPFAARLAGERGVAILNAMPHPSILRFGMAIRTRFIDDLLMEIVGPGNVVGPGAPARSSGAQLRSVSTVLSVGCGLDTRPWRLDLPSDLRWIEVDFPAILDYKEQLMSGETPRCRRERLSVDLNDPAQRHTLYAAAGSAPALMITEGLLMYLPAATVDALAAESAGQSSITHWIIDITTTAFTLAIGGGKDTNQPIRHVQAPDCLKGEQILDILARHRWRTEAKRSYLTDIAFAMKRIRRNMGADATRPPAALPLDDPTGVHRFARG